MAFDTDMLTTKFRSISAMLPVDVTCGGETHSGTRTTVATEKLYLDAGQQAKYSFSVFIAVDDWTTLPANRALVTIAGTEYKIIGKATDAAGVSIRLDVGDKFGGR